MTDHPTGSRSRRQRRLRHRRWIWVLAIAAVYLIPFFSLDGALDIYLKIGDIKGESTAKGYEDEIEIISFGWGGSRDSRTTVSGGLEAPPKDVNTFVFTKQTDLSTPDIILKCLSGQHIGESNLIVTRPGSKGQPLEFLKVRLKDVFVTSYDMEGDDSNAKSTDTFALKFNSLEANYTEFVADGREGSSEVFWSPSTSSGGGGSGGTSLPNTAPTISTITNKTTNEDTAWGPINFTVDDAETAASLLLLGRSSSNTSLLPLAGIVYGGSGANRTVTLTPAANWSGTSTVTVTVTDGSKTASTSFTLTVNPVNDPPSVGNPGAQVTQVGVPLDVNVTLGDIDTPINNVTLTGGEIPPNQQPLVASMADTTETGSVRTFNIVPAAGVTGTTTIVLNAADVPGSSASASFSLTINPAPGGSGPTAIWYDGLESFEPIRVGETTPSGTELGIFEAIDAPGSEYEFVLLDDAGGTFGLGGPMFRNLVVINDALLDFEANPTLSIVVQARDLMMPEQFRAEVFTIEVQNVNEPPAIALPPSFGSLAPDEDLSLHGIVIDDPDSGPEDITATFTVNDGYLALDYTGALAGKMVGNFTNSVSVTAPLADINSVLATPFGLYYRSDPSFTGTETLTVTTDDGGNTGPPGPQTDVASSTLEVELTAWEIWRRANFTAAELLDPTISSFAADPDGDELANGGEYGVDGNPKDPQSGPDKIHLVIFDDGSETYPGITFARRISDPDFAIDVEISAYLQDWISGPAFTFQESVDPLNADYDQPSVRSFFPVSANPRQQIRLSFRLNTP